MLQPPTTESILPTPDPSDPVVIQKNTFKARVLVHLPQDVHLPELWFGLWSNPRRRRINTAYTVIDGMRPGRPDQNVSFDQFRTAIDTLIGSLYEMNVYESGCIVTGRTTVELLLQTLQAEIKSYEAQLAQIIATHNTIRREIEQTAESGKQKLEEQLNQIVRTNRDMLEQSNAKSQETLSQHVMLERTLQEQLTQKILQIEELRREIDKLNRELLEKGQQLNRLQEEKERQRDRLNEEKERKLEEMRKAKDEELKQLQSNYNQLVIVYERTKREHDMLTGQSSQQQEAIAEAYVSKQKLKLIEELFIPMKYRNYIKFNHMSVDQLTTFLGHVRDAHGINDTILTDQKFIESLLLNPAIIPCYSRMLPPSHMQTESLRIENVTAEQPELFQPTASFWRFRCQDGHSTVFGKTRKDKSKAEADLKKHKDEQHQRNRRRMEATIQDVNEPISAHPVSALSSSTLIGATTTTTQLQHHENEDVALDQTRVISAREALERGEENLTVARNIVEDAAYEAAQRHNP